MILICPGYERPDGTRVHEEPIELSRSAPSDTDVVIMRCFDCRGELLRNLMRKLMEAEAANA